MQILSEITGFLVVLGLTCLTLYYILGGVFDLLRSNKETDYKIVVTHYLSEKEYVFYYKNLADLHFGFDYYCSSMGEHDSVEMFVGGKLLKQKL